VNGAAYQLEDGRNSSPAPRTLTPRSLATILSDSKSICAAFGPVLGPTYCVVFTLSCFLLAFAIGRHAGPKAVACDGGMHVLLLVSSGVLFLFMILFMARDIREHRR